MSQHSSDVPIVVKFSIYISLRSSLNWVVSLPPAKEVCEGYVFTGVCLSMLGGGICGFIWGVCVVLFGGAYLSMHCAGGGVSAGGVCL